MSEAQWQRRIIDLAHLLGWLSYHPFDSRRSTAGWPDLALCRDGRLVLAELKTERGRVTPEQRTWLAALSAVPGLEVFCWRPSDWPTVQRVLARDRTPPTPPPAGDPKVFRPLSPHSDLTKADDLGEVVSSGRQSSIPSWPTS